MDESKTDRIPSGSLSGDDGFDYSFVDSLARVAVYDDFLSSPRIVDIMPNTTREYINQLATCVYNSSQEAGGSIPFSIILQVSENFIHSRFKEVVVSVLDGGNTIRFADQGPGIPDKDKAQQPGFSSATAEMKEYIHGVGSGLPIVREYMEMKQGGIQIEDNLESGAVVTISLNREKASSSSDGFDGTDSYPGRFLNTGEAALDRESFLESHSSIKPAQLAASSLSPREMSILQLFLSNNVWGVKDISEETGIPASSTYNELKKLEEAGMMSRLGKKYSITELGIRVAQSEA